ncbi:MAG: hypothetical protein NC410_08075, partial [Oscillibacter sp.]|nr:hypothetical protein [Oscillibacter sp.]
MKKMIILLMMIFLFIGDVFSQSKFFFNSCPGVLINGVCWAKSNVDEPGTFAATPESYGMLYQWNRKKGWSATEAVSGWDSSLPSGTCWNAANDPCPSGWRVPTSGEFDALLDNTNVTSIMASQNGVGGRKFTDNTTGNSIFLPGVYYRSSNNAISHSVNHGFYWSSSSFSFLLASSLNFNENNGEIIWPKHCGLAIRCVIGDPPDCGNIVTDTSVIVCVNDLPYTWGDTTFGIGTESGIYHFQHISIVTGSDSIVNLHLTIQQPFDTTLYDTVCRGDGYYKHGFSLSSVQADGVHTLPLLSRAGCDSVLTLHLKVHPIYDTILYDTVCQGDSYNNHGFSFNAVNASLTHTQTFQTIHGCDSTVTLNLFVWPSYLFSESKDICEGDTITFHSHKLYKSGVYDDSLKSVHGCDSIYRMMLNLHLVHRFSFSGSICSGSSYSNHGFHLPAVYRDTVVCDSFRNVWGCDSIRTLYLTVHPEYDTTFYDTICRGEGYYLHGFSLPEGTLGGTFTQTHQSVHGCDSNVILNLHVWSVYLIPDAQNICDGDTVDFRGRKLYKSGVYYDSLKTVHGCDSIYRMTLDVHPVY